MSEHRALQQLLKEASGEVRYPRTPDLAGSVAVRLEAEDLPAQRWWSSLEIRRPVFAVAALLLVLGLFFSFSSGARRAVAEWLGVSGVRVEMDDSAPTAPARPGDLGLGREVSLAQAMRQASFEVEVPALAPFDRPDAVYTGTLGSGPSISFVYAPGDGIPASELTGTGAILTQFEASIAAESLKKVSGTGGGVRLVELNGGTGFWISGVPHEVGLVDEEGNLISGTSRLAGNVLLWEQGGVTFRFESELGLSRSLEVARSMLPE